jgi:D-2-hydroxyacid dehydrogenase (NADP+)
MPARVVYIGAPEADAASFLERAAADFPTLEIFATDTRAAALEHAGDAEVLIGHHFQFDDALIEHAPRLRWIQSLTTGTDAIVRLRSLSPAVIITSTRGMHGPQMSELVLLDMLALARNFPRILANQRAHRWERWPQPLLSGKTVVIVGVGAIAEALAPVCKRLGMSVCGVSSATRQPAGFDRICPRSQLTEAAASADFLVLLVPLSAATENMIDARVLDAMKPSAFLINVARGGVLDEHALVERLRAGRIAGAALDVFRHTPLGPEDPLWAEERIIITPLLGGMSDVYLEQAYPYVRRNLECYLSGRLDQLVNVVHGAAVRR